MSSTHPLTATIIVFGTVKITVCSNTHSGNTQVRDRQTTEKLRALKIT